MKIDTCNNDVETIGSNYVIISPKISHVYDALTCLDRWHQWYVGQHYQCVNQTGPESSIHVSVIQLRERHPTFISQGIVSPKTAYPATPYLEPIDYYFFSALICTTSFPSGFAISNLGQKPFW